MAVRYVEPLIAALQRSKSRGGPAQSSKLGAAEAGASLQGYIRRRCEFEFEVRNTSLLNPLERDGDEDGDYIGRRLSFHLEQEVPHSLRQANRRGCAVRLDARPIIAEQRHQPPLRDLLVPDNSKVCPPTKQIEV